MFRANNCTDSFVLLVLNKGSFMYICKNCGLKMKNGESKLQQTAPIVPCSKKKNLTRNGSMYPF